MRPDCAPGAVGDLGPKRRGQGCAQIRSVEAVHWRFWAETQSAVLCPRKAEVDGLAKPPIRRGIRPSLWAEPKEVIRPIYWASRHALQAAREQTKILS